MDDEEWDKVRRQIWKIDKQDRILDKIVARRKKKRSFEYEVSSADGDSFWTSRMWF